MDIKQGIREAPVLKEMTTLENQLKELTESIPKLNERLLLVSQSPAPKSEENKERIESRDAVSPLAKRIRNCQETIRRISGEIGSMLIRLEV